MAGHGLGRGTRRGRAAGGALVVLLCATSCSAPGAASDGTRGEVQQVLDRRAAAVLKHDASGYLAAVDPAASALRAAQGAEFTNLAQVPLASWAYQVTGVDHKGAGATAQVDLRYRIQGYDSAPVTAARTLTLNRRGGTWYVTGDRPAPGAAQPLWQQGPVTVVRGARSLILGVGQEPAKLHEIAAAEDAAVPTVSAAWPGTWARRVVVLVPASLDGMAALLGAPAASYRGIAAVTTGEAGGAGAAPADRVIVNPDAYAVLGDLGRRVVLAHETTHVATRAHTSPATPMWLSEGYADWVGYRDTGRTAPQAAPELLKAVRAGDLPAGLPSDADFGFDGGADRLAKAYESGWLACRMIAENWGEAALARFYTEVGDQPHREGALEKAMSDQLGLSPREFTTRWREYVRSRLA
ncbi:hypothetical protein N4G70_04340 [Streptomyces sp. ASQP_92]|uniref:hypothetical protein n=1 Tax=Streptomyces sp. ASQP_92 TaxID=2979116 RepID=UPI0021BDFFEF|nr:hypothetical protein [Streptomyces sp. ASQP_92]MCT9088089.1 hypothetical protein [Streptomyces sp. ASQP_92]